MLELELDLEQKRNVVKANDLVVARYKLTTVEQKIVILLISEIDFQDDSFKEYFITTSNLMNVLGIHDGGGDYKFIANTVDSLMSRVLHIPFKNGDWYKSHWVSSAHYEAEKGGITFCLDEKLKPYLLKLKESFVKYDRRQVLSLSSVYSIRFYEFMVKYRKLGSFRVTLKELKAVLEATGKSYNKYDNFKMRVLEPARLELEEKTDIRFTYKKVTRQKRIVEIDFEIFSNAKNANKQPVSETKPLFSGVPKEPEIVGRLKRAGLKDADAVEIWERKFDYVDSAFRRELVEKGIDFETYIDEKIFIVAMKKDAGKVHNPGGLLVSAIRNNYGSARFTEQVEKKSLAVMRESIAEFEDVKKQLIQRRDKMLQDALKKFLEKNPDVIGEVAGKLLLVAESGISALYNSGKTAAENYKNRLIKGIIDGEIRKSYPKIFAAILKKRDPEIAEIEARIEDLKLQMSTKK